jgi:diacylglycerol kinase
MNGNALQYCAMKRLKKSFSHAIDGLAHAVSRERNLQLFLPVYGVVLIIGAYVHLLTWEWLTLIIAGFSFFAVEMLNTALERLTDVLDDQKKSAGRHYHASMKATKDVAAGGSLVIFIALVFVIAAVFWPYAKIYLF